MDSAVATIGEALDSLFELDVTLIKHMASMVIQSVWYLVSSPSLHMNQSRVFFNDLEEKYLQTNINFEDEERYSLIQISRFFFERELGSPIRLKDVMFIPSLKKNIIFFEFLEDNGYDVILRKGKAFMRHIPMGQVKRIKV